jgi:uncharacterized protein DUF4157
MRHYEMYSDPELESEGTSQHSYAEDFATGDRTQLAARNTGFVSSNGSEVVHSDALRRFSTLQPSSGSGYVLQLQRQYGNRYVQRVISLASKEPDEQQITPEVESTIERKRGGGQSLDAGLRANMESAFASDFGDVRVHTDPEAGALNRAVNAVAFTTGQDIFFGQGAYNPESSSGRELLSHELTHVAQQGGSTVQRKLDLGEPGDSYEQEAEAAARTVARAPLNPAKNRVKEANVIRRYTGEFPWRGPSRFEINGTISGGGSTAALVGTITTLMINANSSGELRLNLSGEYMGMAGSGLTRSFARGEFRLDGQKFPFRCTPEGVLTIESAAIVPGSPTNDPSHMNPFGIGESEIGVSFVASSDGSTFVMETVTFTSGGSGTSVSVGPVGIPVAGGATNSHSVGMRINLVVIGAHPAPAPAPPTSATATATAGATATVTGAAPARVVVPPPHSIYFVNETQTQGDRGELVQWAASLPPATQDAIRTGRLTTTVIGYASTTGTDQVNFEFYSRQRAEWVRGVLAAALGVSPQSLHVGWRGSYTASPKDRSHPGGVPSASERRTDILFAETAPTTAVTTSATGSAKAGATVGP